MTPSMDGEGRRQEAGPGEAGWYVWDRVSNNLCAYVRTRRAARDIRRGLIEANPGSERDWAIFRLPSIVAQADR